MVRNLSAYPITAHEVLACLEDLAKEVSFDRTELVGDLRPTLLQRAIDVVTRHAELARICPEDRLQRLIAISARRCNRAVHGACRTAACLARAREQDSELSPEQNQGVCPDFEIVVVLLNLVWHLREDRKAESA